MFGLIQMRTPNTERVKPLSPTRSLEDRGRGSKASSVQIVRDLVQVPAGARAADGLGDDGLVAADQGTVRRAGAAARGRRGGRLGGRVRLGGGGLPAGCGRVGAGAGLAAAASAA